MNFRVFGKMLAVLFLLNGVIYCSMPQKRVHDFEIEKKTDQALPPPPPVAPVVTPEVKSEPIEFDYKEEQLRSVIPRENRKVGLILGPGSAKGFVHIGVLAELARAKIPIHAVYGMEWGALIAALYAAKGEVNDVEWRALKLQENDLPQVGLFSPSIRADSIERWDGFLRTVFENNKIEDGAVPFACPTISTMHHQVLWIKHGLVREEIKKCLPFPPYFTPYENKFIAAPFALAEAVEEMRATGINLIIFINVIEAGELISTERVAAEYNAQIMWIEGRQSLKRQRALVDEVIGVHTGALGLVDFAERRAFIAKGREVGSEVVKRLITKYGF